MSNHLTLAAVSATLRRILQQAFDTDAPNIPGARVTTTRPNASQTDLPPTGANLFLFQVTPNAAGRNADLVTRRADGTLLQRPAAALDLHYLISFYGDDKRLEPQILLASAVRTLHARPVLERAAIQAMLVDPLFGFMAGADLADAPELVRFTASSLSLEELSKLWSVLLQTTYVPSVTYQASVVFLDLPLPIAASAPPVRRPFVRAAPMFVPRIDRVRSRVGAADPTDQPIAPGATLVLIGHELAGDVTGVRVDGVSVPPSSVTASQVEVPLAPTLRAGPHTVQVVQSTSISTPPAPAQLREVTTSAPAPFILHPAITVAALGGGGVRVRFDPAVGDRQRVTLLLNEVGTTPGDPPQTFRIDRVIPPPPAPPPPSLTDQIDFDAAVAAGGTYLVRVEVDGALSSLDFDVATGRYNKPTVSI